jgi:hypothetical protein
MCLKGLIKVPMMLSCFMQKSWKSWLQIEKNLQVWCFSILCQVAKESRSPLDGGGWALIRTSFGSSPLPLLESCFPMCCPPQCRKAKTFTYSPMELHWVKAAACSWFCHRSDRCWWKHLFKTIFKSSCK